MQQSGFDWKGGQVTYWELDSIDLAVPLLNQLDELEEDLAQVRYPNGLILDFGWYPSYSEEGEFTVMVVERGEPEAWDEPLFKCSSKEDLPRLITEALDFVEQYNLSQWHKLQP